MSTRDRGTGEEKGTGERQRGTRGTGQGAHRGVDKGTGAVDERSKAQGCVDERHTGGVSTRHTGTHTGGARDTQAQRLCR